MERRGEEDEGTLRCGMLKGFFPLHRSADVQVIITPGLSLKVFAASIHFSASAAPALPPAAPQDTGSTFRSFPALAGLQLLVLLALSAPGQPAGPPQHRGPTGPFLLPPPAPTNAAAPLPWSVRGSPLSRSPGDPR